MPVNPVPQPHASTLSTHSKQHYTTENLKMQELFLFFIMFVVFYNACYFTNLLSVIVSGLTILLFCSTLLRQKSIKFRSFPEFRCFFLPRAMKKASNFGLSLNSDAFFLPRAMKKASNFGLFQNPDAFFSPAP